MTSAGETTPLEPALMRAEPWSPARTFTVAALGVALAAAMLAADPAISRAVSAWRPRGDLRRELETIQQFGSISTIALAGLIIWRLDPRRLPRMIDWAIAAALTSAACFILKIALGRPRPKFPGEHLTFLSPFRAYPVREGRPPIHAWEFWRGDVADIWSMPSSHAAAAAAAAVALTRMYPRLAPVAGGLAIVVALTRVVLNAHHPSDTVIGAAVGYVIADIVFRRAPCLRFTRGTNRPAPA